MMKYIDVEEDLENKCIKILMGSDLNKANSFIPGFLQELLYTLKNYENDERFNSLLLSSRSKIFSVGGDIGEMSKDIEGDGPAEYLHSVVPIINDIVFKIISYSIPVISVINGAAAGGGLVLALAGDHRLALKTAKLAMAFGTIGLTPDSGSSVIFPLRFGYSNALFGIATGKIFSAEEAYNLGAIDNYRESMDELMESAMDFASKYGKMDRGAIVGTKKLLVGSLLDRLKVNAKLEYEAIIESSQGQAFRERLQAFLSK